MVHDEKRNIGWDVKKIYELDGTSNLHTQGRPFFAAFGSKCELQGREIHCIITSPKRKSRYAVPDTDGVFIVQRVMLVQECEVAHISIGENLRVNGQAYRVYDVTRPIPGVIRCELEAAIG